MYLVDTLVFRRWKSKREDYKNQWTLRVIKRACQKIIFTIWYLLAWNLISLLFLKSSTFKKYAKSFCDKMIVLYEGCKSLLRTWHYSLTTLVYHILYSHFYQHPYHCCNWLFWGSYLYILSHKMYCCLY